MDHRFAKEALTVSKTNNKKIATTAIEHTAVLEACSEAGRRNGHSITYLPVDSKGHIIIGEIKNHVDGDTCLTSIIHVNNETGVIQDIKGIVAMIKAINKDCIVHVDGVQALGKTSIDADAWGVDLYSMSAHKIHGPKGMGALFVKDTVKLNPILFGAGHQYGLRPGTLNVPGIAGFGRALELAVAQDNGNIQNIKEALYKKLQTSIDEMMLIGGRIEKTAPHILNVVFKGIHGETLLHCLEQDGILVNTGSACSSRKNKVSHVLEAIGVPRDYIKGAIRLSFSRYNTIEETSYAAEKIAGYVKKLRRFS